MIIRYNVAIIVKRAAGQNSWHEIIIVQLAATQFGSFENRKKRRRAFLKIAKVARDLEARVRFDRGLQDHDLPC